MVLGRSKVSQGKPRVMKHYFICISYEYYHIEESIEFNDDVFGWYNAMSKIISVLFEGRN